MEATQKRSTIEAIMPKVATIHCGPYCEAVAIKSLLEVARYEELCKEGTEKDTTRVFPSSTRRRSYRYCDSPSSHQEYKKGDGPIYVSQDGHQSWDRY